MPPPISNLLFLLCKKFSKCETRSYLGLKARIARTEKLVFHIDKFMLIILAFRCLSWDTITIGGVRVGEICRQIVPNTGAARTSSLVRLGRAADEMHAR